MTPSQSISASMAAARSVPQHHLMAAEHLYQASRSHKAAAKLHGSGEHKAADQQAVMARDHTARAVEHVCEAIKKSGPIGCLQ